MALHYMSVYWHLYLAGLIYSTLGIKWFKKEQ